jgi:hypothetical protein
MLADALVKRARQELAAGQHAAAGRTAWQAVNQAMLESNRRCVGDALEVARSLAAVTDGRTRDDMETLERYCQAVIDGAGGGVDGTGVMNWIFSRRTKAPPTDRMRCPECAEDIHVDAKVCRFCGHRLPPRTSADG